MGLFLTEWTDPVITDFIDKNKALHVTELRNAANMLEVKSHDIFTRIGFGLVSRPTVEIDAVDKFRLHIGSFKVYFPDGSYRDFDPMSIGFHGVSVSPFTNERYTSVNNVINLSTVPITSSTGVITADNIEAKKFPGYEPITIIDANPTSGKIQLDLAADQEVAVTYNSGMKRYDVLYVDVQGNVVILRGIPSYLTPAKQIIPDGAVEVLTVLIRPKPLVVGIELVDISMPYFSQASDSGGSILIKGEGALPTAGWTTVGGSYPKRFSFSGANISEDDVVHVYIDKDAHDIADDAELCQTNESYSGGIYFYAKNVPTQVITFSYIVFK